MDCLIILRGASSAVIIKCLCGDHIFQPRVFPVKILKKTIFYYFYFFTWREGVSSAIPVVLEFGWIGLLPFSLLLDLRGQQ